MKYIAIIDTDDFKDFEFFEDGNGKYLVTKDTNAKIDEWIPLYFTECEQEPRWIPVSERLPEESGRYLAYIVNEHDNKWQYIMTCDYSVDGYWNWFPYDECVSDNVIAWMPLPQPYKPQESEE